LARTVVAGSNPSPAELHRWLQTLTQLMESEVATVSAAVSLSEEGLGGDAPAVADLRETAVALRSDDAKRRLRDAGLAAGDAAKTEVGRLAWSLRFCALTCVHLMRTLHAHRRLHALLSPVTHWLSAVLGAACVSRDPSPVQKLFASFGPDVSAFLTDSLNHTEQQQQQQEVLDSSLQALHSAGLEIEAFRVALTKCAEASGLEAEAGTVRALMLQSCLCSAAVWRLIWSASADRVFKKDLQDWLDSYLNYENRTPDQAAFRRLLTQLQDEFHPAEKSEPLSGPYRDVRRQIEQRIRTRALANSLAADRDRRSLLKIPIGENFPLSQQDPAAAKSFNLAARVLEQEVNKWADQENWAVKIVRDIGLRLVTMLKGLQDKSAEDATAQALFRESELIGDGVIRIARFADIVARLCSNKEASEDLQRASKSLVLPSVQLSVLTKTLNSMRDLRRKQRQLLSVVESLMSAAAQLLRCVEACSVAGIELPDDELTAMDSEARQAALLATSWLARLQAHQAEQAAQKDLSELGLRRVGTQRQEGQAETETAPSLVDLLRMGRAVDSE
uniref:PH domain-containing protein n=1 Tax=Macrostomum lignano TaxID=282301 RepID=A0A1I8G902_9PLAT